MRGVSWLSPVCEGDWDVDFADAYVRMRGEGGMGVAA